MLAFRRQMFTDMEEMKRGGSGRQVWLGAGLKFSLKSSFLVAQNIFWPSNRDHLRLHVLLPRITPSPEDWSAFSLCRHLGPTVCPGLCGAGPQEQALLLARLHCCLRVNSCRLSVPSVPSLAKSRTVQQEEGAGGVLRGF